MTIPRKPPSTLPQSSRADHRDGAMRKIPTDWLDPNDSRPPDSPDGSQESTRSITTVLNHSEPDWSTVEELSPRSCAPPEPESLLGPDCPSKSPASTAGVPGPTSAPLRAFNLHALGAGLRRNPSTVLIVRCVFLLLAIVTAVELAVAGHASGSSSRPVPRFPVWLAVQTAMSMTVLTLLSIASALAWLRAARSDSPGTWVCVAVAGMAFSTGILAQCGALMHVAQVTTPPLRAILWPGAKELSIVDRAADLVSRLALHQYLLALAAFVDVTIARVPLHGLFVVALTGGAALWELAAGLLGFRDGSARARIIGACVRVCTVAGVSILNLGWVSVLAARAAHLARANETTQKIAAKERAVRGEAGGGMDIAASRRPDADIGIV